MSDICIFPLCKRIVVREGFCVSHAPYFAGTKSKKQRKKIAYRSLKRKKDQRKYVKIVKRKIEENPFCMVREEGCQVYASGQQHKVKRSPANFLDEENLLNCCDNCQNFCERFPLLAIKRGYSISKFKKVI